MRWATLLSGLLLWGGHFFLAYAVGEFAGTGRGERIVLLLATALLLGLSALIARWILARPHSSDFTSWWRASALGGLSLGALAIIWQTLPVLIA